MIKIQKKLSIQFIQFLLTKLYLKTIISKIVKKKTPRPLRLKETSIFLLVVVRNQTHARAVMWFTFDMETVRLSKGRLIKISFVKSKLQTKTC